MLPCSSRRLPPEPLQPHVPAAADDHVPGRQPHLGAVGRVLLGRRRRLLRRRHRPRRAHRGGKLGGPGKEGDDRGLRQDGHCKPNIRPNSQGENKSSLQLC